MAKPFEVYKKPHDYVNDFYKEWSPISLQYEKRTPEYFDEVRKFKEYWLERYEATQKIRAMSGKGQGDGSRGTIGIPFGLNMYENLPLWFELFTRLNFEVVLSAESSRKLYLKGQRTIPSDTVCYPAKLLHGHVEDLVEKKVDAIFYPCMSYNFDEGVSDNNYNCPVVAYYPELLAANVPNLKTVRYLNPYFGLHRPKDFEKRAMEWFHTEFGVPKKETAAAVKAVLGGHVSDKATLCTDGDASYRRFSKDNGNNLVQIKGGKGAVKGIYHIQHLNAYHSGLKAFLASFRGVSTKYLNNYLTWNNVVGARRGGLAEKALTLLDLVVSALFSETSSAVPNRSPLPILVKNQSKVKL